MSYRVQCAWCDADLGERGGDLDVAEAVSYGMCEHCADAWLGPDPEDDPCYGQCATCDYTGPLFLTGKWWLCWKCRDAEQVEQEVKP